MSPLYGSDTPLPKSRVLRWLVDAGPDVPASIRSMLLDEMVGSATAALMGPLNGVLLNSVALALGGGRVFAALLLIELALLCTRLLVIRRAGRNRGRGEPTPPDAYLIVAMLWCGLQGAIACASIASRILPLQIISTTSVMALIGPICARNYGAPRYAMLLIALCFLPLIIGTQTLGQPWLALMIFQSPLLFIGAGTIIARYHSLSITALQALASSQHRAAHDSLTGLLNRAGLAECMVGENHPRPPLVLFCIDLDGFKPVNDSFGHSAGDAVLAGVAERLRACVRKTDIVARIGGDEFVLIMVGMTASEGHVFADELIRRIAGQPYLIDSGLAARIGVSVGYACSPADGTDIEELRLKADEALYAAKAAGKGVGRRFAAAEAMRGPGGVERRRLAG